MEEKIKPLWVLAVVVSLLALAWLLGIPKALRDPASHTQRMEKEADKCLDGSLDACDRLIELELQKYRR